MPSHCASTTDWQIHSALPLACSFIEHLCPLRSSVFLKFLLHSLHSICSWASTALHCQKLVAPPVPTTRPSLLMNHQPQVPHLTAACLVKTTSAYRFLLSTAHLWQALVQKYFPTHYTLQSFPLIPSLPPEPWCSLRLWFQAVLHFPLYCYQLPSLIPTAFRSLFTTSLRTTHGLANQTGTIVILHPGQVPKPLQTSWCLHLPTAPLLLHMRALFLVGDPNLYIFPDIQPSAAIESHWQHTYSMHISCGNCPSSLPTPLIPWTLSSDHSATMQA